jgi:long-subunit acyl-CoA synthetase (AMP-forming)
VDDIERDIAAVNRGLPDYARVSRFILASAPFTPEHGTATANGRLRRTAIGQRYRHEIAACYAEPVEHYA